MSKPVDAGKKLTERLCDCGIPVVRCDGCYGDFGYDHYEEPPLYVEGKLASMSVTELEAEQMRQNRIHDMAVDRCEEINSPTIETAAARARLVAAEIKRRITVGPS